MASFHLPKGDRTAAIAKVASFLKLLGSDKAWTVTVEPHKPVRSLSQNALLWAIYGQAIERGGELLAGYTKDELHEVMLEQFCGFERYTLLGVEKTRALGRSHNMDKQTFADFLAHIERVLAEQGIAVDMPGDTW